ncbi:DUF47 domain-containing protein [Actinomyces minihominis]|uniref:DUF47 domain-containing protein n=1 Tax=Actinomyces minihominis TaxID=2002838 RepID=UPI000C0826CE|nr:DUF47 family protein [Actinomyces minihominis]
MPKVSRWFRFWSGRQHAVNEMLIKQINVALEATELANMVCSQEADAQRSRKPMRSIEHEGDEARATLVERIDAALTVPLEREDLFRASRAIDDVTDNLRDLVREMAKWEVPSGDWSRDALAPAEAALKHLRASVATRDAERSREACISARYQAGLLRRKYQNGLTRVFSDELTMDTLKKREILRRIDSIGSRLTEASDVLLDGMVKRFL